MKVTTTPSCRVGWKGQTLEYVVKAEGADEIRVVENGVKGLDVAVTQTKRTADGVEAKLAVRVLDSTVY